MAVTWVSNALTGHHSLAWGQLGGAAVSADNPLSLPITFILWCLALLTQPAFCESQFCAGPVVGGVQRSHEKQVGDHTPPAWH